MITLYKEYAIGVKMLSDAELNRESSPSGQTHIGLSEKVLTFLPNTPTETEGILVFNKSCSMVECAFSKIGNKRSTKIDTQTTNPIKSVVKQIRNIASNENVKWYLLWFALENRIPVFWLINNSSDDFEELSSVIDLTQQFAVYNSSKDSFFKILEIVRGLTKLDSLVSQKYDLTSGNRLIAISPEHRTFVHLCLDYFRGMNNLDKMLEYFNTTEQDVPIQVASPTQGFKLTNMFMFSDSEEIARRNSTKQGRRWYTDSFHVDNRELFLYVDWYPGKNQNGQDVQLMIPDFVKFIKACFGTNFVYRNAQGTHEMWLINNPEDIDSFDDDNQEQDVIERDNLPLDFSGFVPSQTIYYGAPGTGKSHAIKNMEDAGLHCIRTTFHPDSDYATFVGCYKPHRNRESGNLTYEFVEQAFLETYRLAWENPRQEIALVIEEINRGNCAQIFGDIFQLLDRDEDGWSTYPIKADTDICERLTDIAIPGYSETMSARYSKDKEGYGFMALPPNMSLLATMNTSDQSLFPIDSAFKRRWDWQYMPIANGGKNWKILIGTAKFDWWQFIKKINAQIGATTSSEDKKLGYYFCKANDGRIDEKTFVGKVIFYLWNDVFKDYEFEGQLFEDTDGEKLTFDKFYKVEAGQTVVETSKILAFLRKLDATINPAVHMEEKGTDSEHENGESSNTSGYVAAKFSLNGSTPMSMTQIAKQVVSDYVAQHPTENGERIRDVFNTACNHIVVETEADFIARLEKAEKTHGGQELVLESGEKIYTSNQWEWKSADSSFARFMTVVNENGWGEIVEIKDNNE